LCGSNPSGEGSYVRIKLNTSDLSGSSPMTLLS
jgi:hypothetical protein